MDHTTPHTISGAARPTIQVPLVEEDVAVDEKVGEGQRRGGGGGFPGG